LTNSLNSIFHQDGAVIIKNQFDQATCLDMIGAYEEIKKNSKSNPSLRDKRFYFGPLPGILGEIYRHQDLVDLMEALFGGENLCLYMKRLLIKDSLFDGDVSLHQDMPYFSGAQKKISVLIPLNTMNRANGGLVYLKGSHKYGMLQRGTIRLENFKKFEELNCDAEIGDIVVSDFLTWHYSVPAISKVERPLLQLVYQPSSDGSYGSSKLGVESPTLVRGRWLTDFFAPWGESVLPDSL